ncbi:MAG: MarR family transcriptional regulator [Treponemataceae bacterium]
MNDTILDLIYLAHGRLTELENNPRDYGTGELLYSSDIHTVVAVALHEGCNLTELAADLGISNAAASKFTAKMVRLGYLIKKQRDDNKKEVVFFLDEKGRQAALAHTVFERRTFRPLRKLEGKLSISEKKVIIDFLNSIYKACTW